MSDFAQALDSLECLEVSNGSSPTAGIGSVLTSGAAHAQRI
jgi:hypothetical protein